MLGPPGWTMPVCEVDLRPGGAWHFVWRSRDGAEMDMRGVYREVSPPERLVATEQWGGDWPETLNTMVFSEEDGMTTITHDDALPVEGGPRRGAGDGHEGRHGHELRSPRRLPRVKYMLLIHGDQKGWNALASWSKEDFRRMVEFMRSLDAELRDSGELLELNGLSGPSGSEPCAPRRMGSRSSATACAAGAQDFLAGYWVVDVASPERAVEIATRISATPGPGGAPVNQQVEVHAIGEPPEV